MSVYSSAPILPQQNHPHNTDFISQYPQLPPSPSSTKQAPQAFTNVDPQLDHAGEQAYSQLQTPNRPTVKSKKADHSSDGKARLRKACDSCSVRKVKCDESGPPCKACVALDLPCTFNRQSKRRGPPNRHAETVKKGRFDSPPGSGMAGLSQPSSPTHAAQTLASIAQQQVVLAETICPWPILQALVDDYFTYIHPLIPLPHKPSFIEALSRREDMNNPTFLALLASMVGCLVASFPRRPRHHFRAHHMENSFPSSMAFITRCHQVITQAQGQGQPNGSSSLDGRLSIHDAIIRYLQGVTSFHIHALQASQSHFSDCLKVLTEIGVLEADYDNVRAPQARMVPNGHSLEGLHPEAVDYVLQELGKRTFWAVFVSVRSLQQVGVPPPKLNVPPATDSYPYPPFPLEVDDDYLTPTTVFPQPAAVVSELTGFNANVRVFLSCNDLAYMEYGHGVDKVFDWDKQKQALENALQPVKQACSGLLNELFLHLHTPKPQSYSQNYPSPALGLSGPQELDFYPGKGGFDDRPIDYNRADERQRIQYEVQKATIYGNQLGTRAYLVEKYFTLSETLRFQTNGNTSSGALAPSLTKPDPSTNNSDTIEQDMLNEGEDIVKNFMLLLSSINQMNMVPTGTSFINKARQIALKLRYKPQNRKGPLALKAEDYLRGFSEILLKLERVDPQLGGLQMSEGSEDDDEIQSRLWAEMSQYQERFVQEGGFF